MEAGNNPAVNAPSRARISMKIFIVGAHKKPILARVKEIRERMINGRLPMRSASEPINGAAISCVRANDMVIRPRASTPEPNSPNLLANTGMIIPKPVIIKPTLPASSMITLRICLGFRFSLLT